MSQFRDTVSALCYSIIEERCRPAATDVEFPHNAVVAFVLGQHGRMPQFLRLPLVVLTLAFDWWGLVRHGRRFHHLPHDRRRRQIAEWRDARLGVCRDFVRFYESLTVFSWFARTEGKSASARASAPSSARTAA